MTTTLPNSYSTNSVYSTVPQFIRDQDAENGYPLWWFIYGSAKAVDQINILTRDNIGQGIHIEADIGNYTGQDITDAQLANSISPSDTTITIFGTDSTWNVFETTNPITFQIVDTLKGTLEQVEIPAGYYDWTAPYVVIEGVTRGFNGTTPLYFDASTGADGSVYMEDWFGAPGWSQAVDITRCPDYALPWLGQFVGAALPANDSQDRQQMVQEIEQRAGFNRATTEAIVAELVAITNQQLSFSITPLSPQQIIVMENTQAQTVGGVNYYTYNSYALTLLVPSRVFSQYTYQSLEAAAAGNSATISGITISGGKATVTTTSAHGFIAGEEITISGVTSPAGLNGSYFVLSSPAPTTNTFAVSTSLTGSVSLSSSASASPVASYSTTENFITSIGGLYFSLAGSTSPNSNSPYINFVYRYRPAGMQIFIGGY